MPKVGEYWFVEIGCEVYLAKIISIKDETCIVKVSGHLFNKDTEDLVSKWEPSLFWRLLGYK